jgi:hypothetical protein
VKFEENVVGAENGAGPFFDFNDEIGSGRDYELRSATLGFTRYTVFFLSVRTISIETTLY